MSSSDLDSPKSAQPTASRTYSALLLLILSLAAAVRLYAVGDSCFWLDEFFSVECSTGRGFEHARLPRDQWLETHPELTTLNTGQPIWRIWTSLDQDCFPPLYYLLLRGWRDVFGESDAAARLFSVIASVAAIGFLSDAVKTAFRPATALWACAIAAVTISQIHYAQEARGYALWEMFGMAACAALVRLEVLGVNKLRCTALGAATLGMMLTHYFAIGTCAALGIYALIALPRHARAAAVLSFAVAAVLFVVVWGPFLLRQRATMADHTNWEMDSQTHHVATTLRGRRSRPSAGSAKPARNGGR